MTELKKRLKNLDWQLKWAEKTRQSMILHLDFCPAEAVPVLLDNISKAERDLKRLARDRRKIAKQLDTLNY